jgi:SAM-dependent methyltransferase
MTSSDPVPSLPVPLPRKLNVGCGYDYRQGYLNVDLHAVHKPDLVADVTRLPMLPDAAFDEIVAQDVLEHFERARTAPALAEWSRLLVAGGVLHVRVPSLLGMFDLLSRPDRRPPARAEEIIHLMYGTQAYNGDYHLAGFTAATLRERFHDAGLRVCRAALMDGWLFDVSARKTSRLADDVEFVHEAYFSLLDRPVDPEGLARCVQALASGAATREAIEASLRGSEEARFLEHYPAYLLPYARQIGRPSLRTRATRSARSIVRALYARLQR